MVCAVVVKNGRLLLTQRPSEGLLGGLWEFLNGPWESGEESTRACVNMVRSVAGLDIKLLGMNYYVDGGLVNTATSAAVIGNPAEAVAWLANTLAPYGHSLQAGQVVMPGSLVAAVDAKPGGHIRADFDHIGSVELRLKP